MPHFGEECVLNKTRQSLCTFTLYDMGKALSTVTTH